MRDLVVLSMQASSRRHLLAHPSIREQVDVLDLYELDAATMAPYTGMIVPMGADQEFLLRRSEAIRAWLDEGKVLAFSGHLFRDWLPGGSPFVPSEISSFRDYFVRIVAQHPVFEGVAEEDLTFRKGVAGFFARGHNPPSNGAQVLLRLNKGEPIVYVDDQSTKGVIFVHSGNDILGYAGATTSAQRMVPQLFSWMRSRGGALSEGKAKK